MCCSLPLRVFSFTDSFVFSIYEKLIEFCGIDEKGTNYPPELYDPSIWGKESYYDALGKYFVFLVEKKTNKLREIFVI